MEQGHDRLVAEALAAYAASWRTLRRSAEPAWTQLQLTIAQLRVLLLLDSRGLLTISQIADLMAVGRPSGSILVDQLVQLALVERAEDPSDRRRTLVRLTALAHTLMADLYHGDEVFVKAWFMRLADDDLKALARGLDALSAVQPGQSDSAEQ